ncbi:hypothetical protein [Ralstonia insidiosa]|jgi:hypothetical protein|nr:hypothetical protein [Ralstonia insidiosa]MBX3904610.1 hypothetical protein [Ralstonia insidiosa]
MDNFTAQAKRLIQDAGAGVVAGPSMSVLGVRLRKPTYVAVTVAAVFATFWLALCDFGSRLTGYDSATYVKVFVFGTLFWGALSVLIGLNGKGWRKLLLATVGHAVVFGATACVAIDEAGGVDKVQALLVEQAKASEHWFLNLGNSRS